MPNDARTTESIANVSDCIRPQYLGLPSSRCILGKRKRGTHGDDFAAESAGLDRYRGPSCARDKVHSLVRLVSFCGGGVGCRGGLLGYFVAHVDRPGFVLDARP